MLLFEKRWRVFFMAGLAGVLSACGDDLVSGEQRPMSSPAGLTIEAVKTFRFDWADVMYNAGRCANYDDTQSVRASNAEAGDRFGVAFSLSADGNTLAVGAEGEDSAATGVNGDQHDNEAEFAGAVYIFTHEAGIWSQQAYLKASNTGVEDFFGVAVSLSADGDTLAIGAVGEDSAATGINGDQNDSEAEFAGAVYVFTREAGIWSQQAYLKASNTGVEDFFGVAVSLSADGDTLAVGAVGEDGEMMGINDGQSDNEAESAGAVYVFTREAGTWSQQAYLKASNAGRFDYFGWAVSLSSSGDTLAVGALNEDGAVYVFAREADAWSQQAYLKASDAPINDRFGALSFLLDPTICRVPARSGNL